MLIPPIEHRSGAKVTLFEAEERCGGHTLTDTTTQWPVDLGFQVSSGCAFAGYVNLRLWQQHAIISI